MEKKTNEIQLKKHELVEEVNKKWIIQKIEANTQLSSQRIRT
jgi:hypothetical protein